MSVIEDGTGTGRTAGVNALNRLENDAISVSRQSFHNSLGKGFSSESALITLTNASESAIWYMKNTGDRDIVIENLFMVLGNSTGGSGDILVKVYVNPTVGTIITNAVAANNNNLRFGDAGTLAADTFKGAQGNTITDGTVCCNIQFPGPGLFPIDPSSFVIPKGATIGITMTPPTGNTSMSVNFATNMYEDTITIL